MSDVVQTSLDFVQPTKFDVRRTLNPRAFYNLCTNPHNHLSWDNYIYETYHASKQPHPRQEMYGPTSWLVSNDCLGVDCSFARNPGSK